MEMNTIYHPETEIAILSCIFQAPEKITELIEQVRVEDFYSTRHQEIYQAMLTRYKKGQAIDLTTLCHELEGKLEKIGGITYLSEIYTTYVFEEHLPSYIEIIKEKSNARKLYATLQHTLKAYEKEKIDMPQLMGKLGASLLQIQNNTVKEDGDTTKVVEDFLDVLEQRMKKGGTIQGIKSGYHKLDKLLNGFLKSDFIILAARPSIGKTAMAVNLAMNMSMESKAKVAFFNLEMGSRQLIERAIASAAYVPMEHIKNGTIQEKAWVRILKEGGKIYDSSMGIYDKTFTLEGIIAACKRRKVQQGLEVVIIDYLQLIEIQGGSRSRNEDVSKISRSLKLLAKELEITVIALSQLSRGVESRVDHRPLLSDLRDSGSIEQDADVVLFLYREAYYDPTYREKDKMECIVAKHRNGEVGTICFKWSPAYQKIHGIL